MKFFDNTIGRLCDDPGPRNDFLNISKANLLMKESILDFIKINFSSVTGCQENEKIRHRWEENVFKKHV